MNTQTIKKILQNQSINVNELNEFIIDYVKLTKNKEITSDELKGIFQLIQLGHFNLTYAAKIAGIKLNLNIRELYDKNGYLLKVIVSEA